MKLELLEKGFSWEPLHHLRWSPSPFRGGFYEIRKGDSLGSPVGELAPQVTEGLLRKAMAWEKVSVGNPSTAWRRSPSPFRGGFYEIGKGDSLGSPVGRPEDVPWAEPVTVGD